VLWHTNKDQRQIYGWLREDYEHVRRTLRDTVKADKLKVITQIENLVSEIVFWRVKISYFNQAVISPLNILRLENHGEALLTEINITVSGSSYY
jgi:hypothetical protein